jgi:hypothetical protein
MTRITVLAGAAAVFILLGIAVLNAGGQGAANPVVVEAATD